MKKETLLRLGLPPFPKTAGSAKEFRDWDLKLEREYPIRYKIRKVIKEIKYQIKRPIWALDRAYWWVQYRVNPKYKHTTIKLKRLDPGYYDPSTLLLYASFEIFEKFMKHQLSDKCFVQWEWDEKCFQDWEWEEYPEKCKEMIEERNKLWKEMNELYDWWVNIYPNRESTLPDFPELPKKWGFLSVVNEDFKDTEEIKEWRRIADIHNKAEVDWDKEDEEMLVRLMKIHNNLWD
jgi:hypothetical protein